MESNVIARAGNREIYCSCGGVPKPMTLIERWGRNSLWNAGADYECTDCGTVKRAKVVISLTGRQRTRFSTLRRSPS